MRGTAITAGLAALASLTPISSAFANSKDATEPALVECKFPVSLPSTADTPQDEFAIYLAGGLKESDEGTEILAFDPKGLLRGGKLSAVAIRDSQVWVMGPDRPAPFLVLMHDMPKPGGAVVGTIGFMENEDTRTGLCVTLTGPEATRRHSEISHAATGEAATGDRQPRMAYSIANVGMMHGKGGTLFESAKVALASANENDAAFARHLVTTADLTLLSVVDGTLSKEPFTAQTARSVRQSCLGPYFVDEAASWVQISWVC